LIVYKVTNQVNGKVYIGQTIKSLAHRWRDHIFRANGGSDYIFHRAIRKNGASNFVCETLCECSTKEEMNREESASIMRAGSKVPAGYNLTDGGEGMFGFTHSEESKAKISAAIKGRRLTEEHRARIGAANMGRKCSDLVLANFRKANCGRIYTDEHRAKIGAAVKGRKHSEETKEKIRQRLMGNTNTLGKTWSYPDRTTNKEARN
jgi:group I intron endonuclease